MRTLVLVLLLWAPAPLPLAQAGVSCSTDPFGMVETCQDDGYLRVCAGAIYAGVCETTTQSEAAITHQTDLVFCPLGCEGVLLNETFSPRGDQASVRACAVVCERFRAEAGEDGIRGNVTEGCILACAPDIGADPDGAHARLLVSCVGLPFVAGCQDIDARFGAEGAAVAIASSCAYVSNGAWVRMCGPSALAEAQPGRAASAEATPVCASGYALLLPIGYCERIRS